ncbi:MAG: exodeoxyribonuclease VII large subunit, partial [Bacteroidaceae bacterium]|nr:exodeoxyribonuclease VII large subunit [Bacteroidaceae bacterium]
MVLVTVTYHELYGMSLTIHDINPTYTIGEAARRRAEIIAQLEEDGTINDNKELPLPMLPRRIAVISSSTAAGYG